MENPIIIFGTGPSALAALDIFQSNDIIVYGFLDDEVKLHGTEIQMIPVLGRTDDEGFTKLIGKKADAFVAVESRKERVAITDYLLETRKVMPVNAIHATAAVSALATLHHGSMFGANAVVQPGVTIGSHCIIGPGAVIDTNATIGENVIISTGARIGANATIESGAFIGTGAIVVPSITIHKNASVGAGSVVVEPVSSGNTVFGNPAKKVA